MSEIVSSPPAARRRRSLAVVVVALLALGAAFVGPATGSSAGAATADGPAAAAQAAGWLAARVTPEGFVPDALGDPSPGDTLQTAVALATAGVGYDAFTRTTAWLAANVDAVTGTGPDTSPGQIGYLLIVVDAAGADATDFGGVDLGGPTGVHARRLRAGPLRRQRPDLRRRVPPEPGAHRAGRSGGGPAVGEPSPGSTPSSAAPRTRPSVAGGRPIASSPTPAPPAAPSPSPVSTRTARPSPRPRWRRSA